MALHYKQKIFVSAEDMSGTSSFVALLYKMVCKYIILKPNYMMNRKNMFHFYQVWYHSFRIIDRIGNSAKTRLSLIESINHA